MCVGIQFSKHHLLKRLPFTHCGALAPLSKVIWPHTRVYFRTFYFVPLVSIAVIMLVPYCFDCRSFMICFINRLCEASRFVFLSQDCFGSLGIIETLDCKDTGSLTFHMYTFTEVHVFTCSLATFKPAGCFYVQCPFGSAEVKSIVFCCGKYNKDENGWWSLCCVVDGQGSPVIFFIILK